MHQLLKKEFNIVIHETTITYKQLSFYDCLEFDYLLNINKFDPLDWILSFLGNKGFSEKQILQLDLGLFFKTYCETALRGFYLKVKHKEKSEINSPGSSGMLFLSQQLGIDVLTMMKTYTPEAINFLIEGVERNINAQTKEGKIRNQRKIWAKQLKNGDNDEDLAKIKEMREKRKNLVNNPK